MNAGKETKQKIARLKRRIIQSLLQVGLVAISSTAMAQVCNDMQFTDVTATAGINHVFVWPPTSNASTVGGATAVDVNGDGWLDIYVGQGDAGTNLLYINDQNGGFTEEAVARGAGLAGFFTTGASAADYDNDGDIDIGVSLYYDSPMILVNDGTGHFTVTVLLWPNQRTFSSSWGDVDNDGLLEFAIGQWMSKNETGPQGLYIYKNNSGVLDQYEFRTNPQNDKHVFAPRFADLNGDRLSDLHVIADYGASRVFMNVGGGMFTESAGFGGNNDMGHTIGDYDKDGDLDIFTTDIETKAGNTLWNNDGLGNFTNVSSTAGIAAGGWAWGGSFGDLDLDADLDIYHVNGFVGDADIWKDNPNLLFMNNDDGTFTDVAACAGADIPIGSQGRGVHLFDYDNDGDLDIFVVNNRWLEVGKAGSEGIPVLLRNDTPRNGKHWLKVTLDGTPPMHRDGIGSRVYVTTGSTTQMHEMHASTNFLSQDSGHIAHFGLNTTSVADLVTAEWVSGDATVLNSVNGDQQISIPSPTATLSTRTPAIGQDVTATSNESAPVEWEVGGVIFADPVTTSFSTGGTQELTLRVYNTAMTQVLRTELIRVDVAGTAGTPAMTSPAPGSTFAAGDVSFAWNSNGAAVTDWQLLIGTSVGTSNLYDSGVLPGSTTAAVVSGLPEDSSTLHVTLRWTAGGSSTDLGYTYTAASTGGSGGVPMMLSPADGSTLAGASDTFTWSAEGAAVSNWRLEVGTTAGSADLYGKSWTTATTSQTVTVLPTDGSTVFVKLKWKIGGVVAEANYVYTASGGAVPTPALTAPTPGSTFPAGDVSFAWSSNGAVVDDWQLLAGTSVGGSSLYDSGVLAVATTSALVSGLPEDGSTIHVTLRWTVGGVPSESNYTYTAFDPPPPPVPALTSPTPGSTLAAGDVSFGWDSNGATVDDWQLLVGTTVGGSTLYDSGVLVVTTTSATVTGLPEDGSTLHVTLRWTVAGVASELNYTYTAATAGGSGGVPMILSPLESTTLAGASETFTWSAEGAAVTNWRLEVGTSAGAKDLFGKSWSSSVTSTEVTGLPTDGSLVYVKLKWKSGGVVDEVNYVYTASGGGPPPPPTPALTSPLPGSTLALGDITYTWADNGATVDDWQLQVGTSVGDNSLFDSGILVVTTTSVTVTGLPEDGSTLHVTLRWNEGGVPNELNYTYIAATAGGSGGVPMILSPLESTILAGSSETFTWSAEGAVVTNWRLEVGTSAGARDLYGKSWGSTVTSTVVSGLPTDGSLVYVKLKWKIGGVVAEVNYVYTAAIL